VDLDGKADTVAEIDDKPSGIGFLPDGTPIVVCMRRRTVVRIGPDGALAPYADVTGLPGDSLNDMVVDGRGRAFVDNRTRRGYAPGTPGWDQPRHEEGIVLIDPHGVVRQVSHDMVAPNGLVISPDGRTLIVAEQLARRLTALDIEDDGSLTNRREYATTGDADPDGIALDAEGAVWIAAPQRGVFRRVLPGGRVTDEIATPEGKWAVACILGGPDGCTLFMITTWETMDNLMSLVDFEADLTSTSEGSVEVMRVDVPGAGWP
jgi:sugar lactone lactonase YvrE